MQRSNPEESSLPLPQNAKKRKRGPTSPASPHIDKALISLFCNSLCSLPSIPHSQTLLLLEGSASLILQSNKHPKSKSAMISLIGSFLHRVQPPTTKTKKNPLLREDEEKRLVISASFLETLLKALKDSLMYLHSLSSSHSGDGGARGWEDKSGEGQWGWEMCLRVFCYNDALLPKFLLLVENEAKDFVQSGKNQSPLPKKSKTSPSTSSSSSSILELDNLISCVTHLINTPLLHSRLRDCTEECENFSTSITNLCKSSSVPPLLLSLRVALGKESV